MKVLKTPEENIKVRIDPRAHFQAEVTCKRLPYYCNNEACGALLLVDEKDVNWADYDLPASGGRGPRDAGTKYFAICGHCKGFLYLADTFGHLDEEYLTEIQAERIKRSKPEFDYKKHWGD